jgi:hypothetical protein
MASMGSVIHITFLPMSHEIFPGVAFAFMGKKLQVSQANVTEHH